MIKPKYSNGQEVKVGDYVIGIEGEVCIVTEVWDGQTESPSDDIMLKDIMLDVEYSYRALDIEYLMVKIQ